MTVLKVLILCTNINYFKREHQGLVPVSFNGKISNGIIQRVATDQRVL